MSGTTTTDTATNPGVRSVTPGSASLRRWSGCEDRECRRELGSALLLLVGCHRWVATQAVLLLFSWWSCQAVLATSEVVTPLTLNTATTEPSSLRNSNASAPCSSP